MSKKTQGRHTGTKDNEILIPSFESFLKGGNPIRAASSILPSALFHHVVDQSSTAISITDTHANILYANPAFSEMTGYAIDEVIGKNESMLSDKNTPRSVYQALWATLKRGNSWCGLLVNRRKDGTQYLAEVTISPITDDDGNLSHYLGIHRDISELHKLQKKVMNQKALIETVVDAAPVMVVLLDQNDKVILDNHAYKKLHSSFQGKEPTDILITALREKMGKKYDDFRKNHTAFENQEISIDQGGKHESRWFSCSGVWVEEKDESIIGFFSSDKQNYLLLTAIETTSMKRQQEELRRTAMRELIIEEEWGQTMRETMAGAIYQFQKPVNLIAAATGILGRRKDDKNENTALKNVLNQALSSGQEALKTIRESMPSKPDDRRTPLNLNQVIRDVLSISTGRLISQGVVVDWKPAMVLPALLGSEKRLQGVFKQLIDNAIEAMSKHRHSSRELTITTFADDQFVYVTIKDTGPGIPEELRVKVFEPFFTTNPGKKGAGMGLSSVQEVINDHAGSLIIDPAFQDGCCIRIILPFSAGSS